MADKPTPYHWNVLHSLDVLANSALGGLKRQTLSARLGLLARMNGGKVPRGSVVGIGRVVHVSLEYFWPGHCEEAIASEEHLWDLGQHFEKRDD